MQAGDPQSGYREYVRASDLLPGNNDVQLKAATFLLASQQFEDARVRVARVLKKDPKNVNALILLGSALAGLRDFDAALKQIEQAVQLDATSAPAYATLGTIQAARGRQQEAEAAFRKAVATNPQRADVHLALANFLWTGGRIAESGGVAPRKPWSSSRGTRWRTARLATFYLATRRAPEAERYLRAAAKTDTDPAAPLKLALADYYVSLNRVDAATTLLTQLAKNRATGTAARTRLAVLAYEHTGHADGHRAIDAVLATAPRDVPALLVKARFLLAGREDRRRAGQGPDRDRHRPFIGAGALPARIDSPPARRHRPRDGGVQ